MTRDEAIRLINQKSNNLASLPQEFRNDRDIVKIAIQQNPQSYIYASSELLADKELALYAISLGFNRLPMLDDKLLADKELILKIMPKLPHNPRFLEQISDTLQDDPDITYEYVKRDPEFIRNISSKFYSNIDFIIRLLSEDIVEIMRYVRENVQLKVFRQVPGYVSKVPLELLTLKVRQEFAAYLDLGEIGL